MLSIGPFTTKIKDEFEIDHKDDAVRGMLVLEKGAMMWPPPAPPAPPVKVVAEVKEVPVPVPVDPYQLYMKSALYATAGSGAFLAFGSGVAPPILATFSLSTIIGYYTVFGVAPALHSPLMAVTNAISGMTALGGLTLVGGGLMPTNTAEYLGAYAQASQHARDYAVFRSKALAFSLSLSSFFSPFPDNIYLEIQTMDRSQTRRRKRSLVRLFSLEHSRDRNTLERASRTAPVLHLRQNPTRTDISKSTDPVSCLEKIGPR